MTGWATSRTGSLHAGAAKAWTVTESDGGAATSTNAFPTPLVSSSYELTTEPAWSVTRSTTGTPGPTCWPRASRTLAMIWRDVRPSARHTPSSTCSNSIRSGAAPSAAMSPDVMDTRPLSALTSNAN